MRICKAPTTRRGYEAATKGRKEWCKMKGVDDDEESFLLYAVDRARSVGSSAIGLDKAAFAFGNGPLSQYVEKFIGELLESKRRVEATGREDTTTVSKDDIAKVWRLLETSADAKTDRDGLIVVLSFEALLRSAEAAELRWDDLDQIGPLLKVKIRKAKNDQLGLGRTTFVNCRQGSELDLLLNRWRVRAGNSSPYVFANMANGKQLSPSAVAASAKKLLLLVGRPDASHHSLRRGKANELLQEGLNKDQVQQRGRWRSASGIARYLKDSPEAQGFFNS